MPEKSLEIEVLGPVRARRGGVELAIGGPVDRAVLGLLAAQAGRRVATDALLQGAYPGVSRASAKGALQNSIWRLRRALGDDGHLLVTDRDGYRLDLDARACDAGALRQALVDANAARRDGRLADAERLLAEGASRWRGRAPELPRAVIEGLDALASEVVERLVEVLLEQGRRGDALDALRLLLDDHPGRARALGLLATATEQEAAGRSPAAPAEELAVVLADPAVADVIAMASVLGHATMAELVAALDGWYQPHRAGEAERSRSAAPDRPAVVAALLAGERAGVLTTTGRPVRTASVAREDLAAEVLEARRPEHVLDMHRVAAAALQQVHGQNPGPHLLAIAEHLLEAVPAVDVGIAVDALVAAGSHVSATDPKVASSLLERAADVLDAWLPGDDDRRIDVLLELGRALDAGGDHDGADGAWEQVAALAMAAGRPTALALASLELAGTAFRPRSYARAAELLEDAVAARSLDDELRSLVVVRRIQLLKFAPTATPAAPVDLAADRLLLAGLSPDDRAPQATLALARWVAGVEAGTATFEDDHDVEAVVAAAGDVPTLQLLWERWCITRDTSRARFAAGEARLVDLAVRVQRWRERAQTEMQRDDLDRARPAAAMQLAFIRAYQGRTGEAGELALARPAPTPSARSVHIDDRAIHALFAVRGGDRARAETLVADVLKDLWDHPIDRCRYATAMLAAYVVADLALPREVEQLLAELETEQGRHCLIGYVGYGGATEHALGRLRAARGDLEEADALLERGLAAHQQVGAVVFADRSRFYRAEVLDRMGGAGRRGEAGELRAEIGRGWWAGPTEAIGGLPEP